MESGLTWGRRPELLGSVAVAWMAQGLGGWQQLHLFHVCHHLVAELPELLGVDVVDHLGRPERVHLEPVALVGEVAPQLAVLPDLVEELVQVHLVQEAGHVQPEVVASDEL
jgi:hypothetical protein